METVMICVSVILLQRSLIIAQSNTVTVTTAYGDVQGMIKSNNNAQYNAFLGIPFAKPPTESRRFKAPKRLDSWEGVRDAFAHAPACPQRIEDDDDDMEISEDCLYLDVYVTGNITDPPRLPVMVYIHGGGLEEGAASEYPGDAIVTAGRAIVLVIIQYRLGFLGFGTSGDGSISEMNGLKDQVFALEWVQENIKYFNGDKSRVTIFGESSGGSSVLLHMVSPMSDGLFHRAISQSAAASWRLGDRKRLRKNMEHVARELGCTRDDTVSCVQNIDYERIIDNEFNEPMLVIDGEFITDHPKHLYARGRINDAQLIIGFNTDDGDVIGNLFLLRADDRGAVSDPVAYRAAIGYCLVSHLSAQLHEDEDDNDGPESDEDDDEESDDRNGDEDVTSADDVTVTSNDNEVEGTEIEELYPILDGYIMAYGGELAVTRFGKELTNTQQLMDLAAGKYVAFGDSILNTRGFMDAFRDTLFTSFSVWVANQVQQHGGNVRFYTFEHRTSYFGDPASDSVPLYAPHGADIEYVFGFGLLEDHPTNVTEEEKALARNMITAWTSFAENGLPYITFGGQEEAWPPYTAHNTHYIAFDVDMTGDDIRNLSSTWQPVADFWLAIDSLAIFEDDADRESSSEEFESHILKMDSFQADVSVILLACVAFLLLLATIGLSCTLCNGSSGSKYIA